MEFLKKSKIEKDYIGENCLMINYSAVIDIALFEINIFPL
jgi:hypothetical protein